MLFTTTGNPGLVLAVFVASERVGVSGGVFVSDISVSCPLNDVLVLASSRSVFVNSGGSIVRTGSTPLSLLSRAFDRN